MKVDRSFTCNSLVSETTQINNPQTGEQINKLIIIHARESYLTIKRNEIFIHTTTYINNKIIIQHDRNQTPSLKSTFYMIVFI